MTTRTWRLGDPPLPKPPLALVPAHMEVMDVYWIGQSFEALADALRGKSTPYPSCYGAPTKAACLEAGYCRRNPSCGD